MGVSPRNGFLTHFSGRLTGKSTSFQGATRFSGQQEAIHSDLFEKTQLSFSTSPKYRVSFGKSGGSSDGNGGRYVDSFS